MTMNIFLVIPTIRNLNFLKEWGNELGRVSIIVVEDSKKRSITIPKIKCKKIFHYSHEEIEKNLGEKSWIFPWKSAAVRAYGFLEAYQKGCDIVITLDDDCYPAEENFVKKHLENLRLKTPEGWFPTFPHAKFLYTRGIPYKVRDKYPVVLSHGLWSGAIDLDAQTEIKLKKKLNLQPFDYPLRFFIPRGFFFPMCSMNLAFTREVTPLMYQMLMGSDDQGKPWGYDRFDDVWSGIFVKKIIDHLKLGVVSGSPYVRHARASNVFNNLKKEAKGIKKNEILWRRVEEVRLTKNTPIGCYKELIKKIKFPKERYFEKLKIAMRIWISFFEEKMEE